MNWREDATTRDGVALPIPWEKELRLFWTPMAKKPKANKRRAVVPPAKRLASVPKSDMIWLGNNVTATQHSNPHNKLISPAFTTTSPTRARRRQRLSTSCPGQLSGPAGTLVEKTSPVVLYGVIRGRAIADSQKVGNTVAKMARNASDQSSNYVRSGAG
jgi:hypothetical protein